MQVGEILGKIFYWGKRIGKMIIGGVILVIQGILKLMSFLHIGDVLSKLFGKIGLSIAPKNLERILCVILCLVLIIGLFSMCAPDKESGSSGGLFDNRCGTCSGSGNCGECGGSGRVTEWMGDQYMDLRCTSCSGGRCPSCNGSGRR